MRRPHFALAPRLVVGVACVAAVLQLSGYRPHADTSLLQGSAATSNSVDTRFPPPQSEPPDDWAAEPPRGVPVATCPLTPDEKQDLLLSFVYRIGNTLDEIERVSEKTLSIDTCYRAPFKFPQGKGGWFPTLVLGIIRVDHKESDVTDPANHYLALFVGESHFFKGVETSLQGGYNAGYDFAAIPTAGEVNPLIFVRRNEGASGREITYELYRVEDQPLRLKRLWDWADSYGHSTSGAYSISNIDFSGMTGSRKRITVYTTAGIVRRFFEGNDLTPKYRVTSFVWNATKDMFVEASRKQP